MLLCWFLCDYLDVTAKCPAYHVIRTLTSMPDCCCIARVILMRPIRSRTSIWGLLFIPLHVLVLRCQVPCSPSTQELVARVRAIRTSISYQRIRRPYPRIFPKICLFLHASFFIQFQNVLYLPYIWKCISKCFIVLWLLQLAVTFWINCFVWSTSTLCASTQLHTGKRPFSRNAWLLSQDSDTVTRKYLGAQSDYHPSSSLGA